MSGGTACKCGEAQEPLSAAGNRPARLWRVLQRHCNHSAFNGWRYTPSDYSSIACLRCGRCWRTKASYVAALPDIAETERQLCPGVAGYAEAMEGFGREPL
jgi:hypothetical protein